MDGSLYISSAKHINDLTRFMLLPHVRRIVIASETARIAPS